MVNCGYMKAFLSAGICVDSDEIFIIVFVIAIEVCLHMASQGSN